MRASFAAYLLLAILVLGGGGCRDASSGESALQEPRRSLLTDGETYKPPDDAVLTTAQVDAYLKVRGATVRPLASPGGAVPLEGEEGISRATLARAAEMRAARQLSVPPEEYLWVRERILEAEAATITAELNADVLALLRKSLATLRQRRLEAPDDSSRQLLDEQIASFEAEAVRVRREAAEKEPESIRANLRILAPYRQRISAVADELSGLRATDAAPLPSPSR